MTRIPAAAGAVEEFVARLAEGPYGSVGGSPALGVGPQPAAWFVQMAASLFGGQDSGRADAWARRLHAGMGGPGGQVPFRVVHDWHVRTVAPLLTQASVRCGADGEDQEGVRRLHSRALAGERVTETEWAGALVPALTEVYRRAYPYADAHAAASAGAHAYAMDNDYGEERAAEFASFYAELNTDANARSFADANALANARALAVAFADADEHALADAYPFAYVHACALAVARADGAGEGRPGRYRAACERLADGLADSVGRGAS
ncbi:SpcZ [Streptomyces sp. NPDC051993]|uniref:SpcZ n=1 Tax=unclassified Streptomyces TaxID=2593676 RepID=UPI00341E0E29